MSEHYCILGVETIKSFSKLAQVENHNRRLHAPANADPARRGLNVDWMGKEFEHLSFQARAERLLKEKEITPHGRGILAVELLLGMSPGAQATLSLEKWEKAALATAQKIAPPSSIIGADVHYDEETPHLHVVFLPIVKTKRKRRGPAPQNGVRGAKEVSVLSFAEFAGHKGADVAASFARYHDIYAAETDGMGLQRGTRGVSAKHLPQQRLYAETAKIEADGEKLLQLLERPAQLVGQMRRPTADELADDQKWAAYCAHVSGNFSAFLRQAKLEIPGLMELAKHGTFERRARESLKNLDRDRNGWMNRALSAEKKNEGLMEAHAREIRVLKGRLLDLEAPPLKARDAAAMLGIPVFTGVTATGNTVDRIVNLAGEVLSLSGNCFLRPAGQKQSVIKFLQQELGFEKPQEIIAYLSHRIGLGPTAATHLDAMRLVDACLSKPQLDAVHPNAAARRGALQANLESRIGVSQKTTNRLFAEGLLTVNSMGQGVLVPSGCGYGYVFAVESNACRTISSPPNFTTMEVGPRCTWTTVVTDDPALVLRVVDAAQGLVSTQLVPPESITETRLQDLRREHREVLATPAVFAPSWNPAQSAVVRPGDECLRAVTEIIRGGVGPFFTRDHEQLPSRPSRGVEFSL